jgi:tetratricopeptide (TPR) repeat protein
MAPVAIAHGDLHEQIAAVTGRLQQQPTAELFLKRGELHRAHAEHEAALADFDRAEQLKPALDAARLCRGLCLLQAGKPAEAREALNEFLIRRPEHAEGHAARARAQVRLKQFMEAAADFDRAIALTDEPKPDYFVERARALVEASDFDRAIRGLDAGLKQLGALPTFESLAMEIELKVQRYDAALARVDRLIARSARKETWLERRGEILAQAGRPEEARHAFADALATLERLPDRIRNNAATKELAARLRAVVSATPVPVIQTR